MAKRANGDGSIYQRKDGRWCASLSIGRGKRQHFLGYSRADVSKQLTASMKERDDGLPVITEHPSTEKFLLSWLEAARPTLRERTHDRYEQYVRLHPIPTLGTIKLSKLSPQHLQRLYSERLDAGLSPTTVHHLHATLHKALKWNLVSRNVADLVEPPRPARFEMATLSSGEAHRLLDTAAGDRLEALYVLALTTGMREGEILGLRWADVDLGAASVRIRCSLQATRSGLRITEPKTAGSRRQVLLSQQCIDAMKRHRVLQAEERLRMGSAWQDNDLVFANAVGKPIAAGNLLRRSFEPLVTRAGLPRMRFHDLRHTAATLLLAQGVHPKIVSEMLGHTKISTTLDLYSHVTPTMQREAASAMDAIFAR